MAFDTYIKIDDVAGEAKAKGVEGQIEIYSFSWGASNPVSASSSGGEHLSAGSLVFAGGLTAAVPIRPGHAVTAEFDGLGTVEVFARAN